MSGVTKFDVEVYVKGQQVLPELQGRLDDLSPAFDAIIKEWAGLNAQKFGASRGMERSGVQMDEGVFWEPLAASTIEKKHPNGAPKTKRVTKSRIEYPDWLMVETGSLMRSMTDPDLVHQAITGQDAVFGTPIDPEDLKKVQYNFFKRQVIFLSVQDQNSIRRIIQDYLGNGPEFASIRMARGAAVAEMRGNVARMDQEFDGGS